MARRIRAKRPKRLERYNRRRRYWIWYLQQNNTGPGDPIIPVPPLPSGIWDDLPNQDELIFATSGQVSDDGKWLYGGPGYHCPNGQVVATSFYGNSGNYGALTRPAIAGDFVFKYIVNITDGNTNDNHIWSGNYCYHKVLTSGHHRIGIDGVNSSFSEVPFSFATVYLCVLERVGSDVTLTVYDSSGALVGTQTRVYNTSPLEVSHIGALPNGTQPMLGWSWDYLLEDSTGRKLDLAMICVGSGTEFSSTAGLPDCVWNPLVPAQLPSHPGVPTQYSIDSTGTNRANEDGYSVLDTVDDIVINGGFDDDSAWAVSTWTISDGEAHADVGSYKAIQQYGLLEVGKEYELTFSITSYTSGSCWIGSTSTIGTLRSGVGTWTIRWVADSTSLAVESAGQGFVGSIDNVSALPVVPEYVVPAAYFDEQPDTVVNGGFNTDTDWVKQEGWVIADGVATYGGADYNYISQLNAVVPGETYVITYNVLNASPGSDRITVRTEPTTNLHISEGNGPQSTGPIVAVGTELMFYAAYNAGRFDGSIDNITCVRQKREGETQCRGPIAADMLLGGIGIQGDGVRYVELAEAVVLSDFSLVLDIDAETSEIIYPVGNNSPAWDSYIKRDTAWRVRISSSFNYDFPELPLGDKLTLTRSGTTLTAECEGVSQSLTCVTNDFTIAGMNYLSPAVMTYRNLKIYNASDELIHYWPMEDGQPGQAVAKVEDVKGYNHGTIIEPVAAQLPSTPEDPYPIQRALETAWVQTEVGPCYRMVGGYNKDKEGIDGIIGYALGVNITQDPAGTFTCDSSGTGNDNRLLATTSLGDNAASRIYFTVLVSGDFSYHSETGYINLGELLPGDYNFYAVLASGNAAIKIETSGAKINNLIVKQVTLGYYCEDMNNPGYDVDGDPIQWKANQYETFLNAGILVQGSIGPKTQALTTWKDGAWVDVPPLPFNIDDQEFYCDKGFALYNTPQDAESIESITEVICTDQTPDPFEFQDQINVEPFTLTTSFPVIISGMDDGCPVSVTDGEYDINQSDVWTAAAGVINSGDLIRVRRQSGDFSTVVQVEFTAGTESSTFSITAREEGAEYLYDSDGNIMVDSDGNPVMKP